MKDRFRKVLDIFITFMKFGCFTFGGGWSILAQVQKEYVEKKKWVTDEELLDYTAVGRSLPGIMIGNISIIFGYNVAGIPGAIAAVLGISIPPFAIMVGVTFLYDLVKDNLYVARAMMGVRCAVVPIIVNAVIKLSKAGMKNVFCWIAAAAAFVIALLGGSNVLVVLLGAAAGLIYNGVRKQNDIS